MKVFKLLFIASILSMCAAVLSAQTDTTYIRKYNYCLTLSPGLVYKDFKVSFDTDFSKPVFFQNRSFGLKVRLKYKWLGLYYTFPLASLDEVRGANSRHFGGTLSIYRPKYLLRLGMRRFNGFTNQENNPSLSDLFLENMRMWHNTLDYIYVISNQQYSLRSAFKFSARQLRSKGSLLFSSQLTYQNIAADSISLAVSADGTNLLDKYQNWKLGLGSGYAYTYVNNRFFATLVIIGGLEFRRLVYNFELNRETDHRWRLSPRIESKFGLGITGKRFFAGINGYFIPNLDFAQNLNTRVRDIRIQFVLGLRLSNYEPTEQDF